MSTSDPATNHSESPERGVTAALARFAPSSRSIAALEDWMEYLELAIIGFSIPLSVGVTAEIWCTGRAWATCVAVGVAGETTCAVLHSVLSARHRILTHRRDREQDQEIARARGDAINAQWKLSPRTFTPGQRQALIDDMSDFPGRTVEIVAGRGEAEARNFGLEIAEVFRAAGWDVEGKGVMTGDAASLKPTDSWHGVAVSTIRVPTDRETTKADRELWTASGFLAKFLVDNGFDAAHTDAQFGPRAEGAALRIVVCRKLF